MEAISFKLDAFEGPLDLLLHLVTKHKLNIYDIEISLLLEQYLAYIEGIETRDYEQAADFLEMAARLIYIKTCYLLPQPEEAEELKKELQGRMIEYSLCKLAAERLREDYAGGTVFVRQPVKLPVNKQYTREHDKQELYEAYMLISAKVKEYKPLRANMFSPIVSKRIVSVESKITQILERLYTCGSFDMARLYDGMEDRSEKIAAFLAVLELTKSGRIFLNDDNTRIELRHRPEDGEALPEIEVTTDRPQEEPVPAETENVNESEETAEPEAEEIAEAEEEAVIGEMTEPEVEDAVEEAPEAVEEIKAEEVIEDVPEAVETAEAEEVAESETAPETEKAPEPEEQPVRNYSVQLARSAYTMTLRVGEPKLRPEDVGEFVSLFDEREDDKDETEEQTEDKLEPVPEIQKYEPETVAVFLPIVPREESTETAVGEDEEPPVTAVRLNYFARRYYWGFAPLEGGRRACREARLLRI